MTGERAPLSAAAVAVRLRRFWLGTADAEAVRRSDLAEVWRDIAVRRTAETLMLHTPYDFGNGDPLDGGLGAYLTQRIEAISGGTVREVSWCFDEWADKPVRRARSSDLDIHEPGDPGLDEYDTVLARLRKAIPRDTDGSVREVLRGLGLAGVSRHRLWFVAGDDAGAKAVGRTPGAAYALHAAVQRVQRADPLYRIVVDDEIDAAVL